MTRNRSYLTCLLAGWSALATVHSTAQVFLTDAVLFFADDQGNVGGHNWWVTPTTSAYVLFLKDGGLSGEFFLNGYGNPPNFALTPGTYTIGLLAEPGGLLGYHGLNLYFNGSKTADISAYAPDLQSLSDPHTFFVNSSESAISLEGSAAAGSLTYVSGGLQVTLTDFHLGVPSLYAVDQVSAYGASPSGALDHAGAFTLEVTVVPEPQALVAVMALGLAGFAWVRRYRA